MHEHDEEDQSERWYLPKSRRTTKVLGKSWIGRLEGFWALREFGDPENFWKRKKLLMEKTGPIYTKVQARFQRLGLRLGFRIQRQGFDSHSWR